MFRIGRKIRAAKMNASAPPKLMPPFHSTAASGIFPTEHTNEITATSGPTIGPHSVASSGWSTPKNDCQNSTGTHAASAPAINRPPAMSSHTEAQSITKEWLIAVNPCSEVMRCQRLPSPQTDISISAWPSIRPAMPLSACRLASSSRSRVRNRRNSTTNSATISGAPMNSASVNCQPKNTSMMMASSTTRLVEAISNAIAAVKWAPLAEQRAGNRDRRIGARRRGCPQRERGRNGTRPVVGQQAGHFPMRNHRLHYRRQCEAENERPQDLPSHGERHAEGAQDGINHRKPPLKYLRKARAH